MIAMAKRARPKLRGILAALRRGSFVFASCFYLVACSAHRHPDISNSTDGALQYIEVKCANGAHIRTLSEQSDADRAIGNNAASEADGLLLDKEFVICSTETSDVWTTQVAKLMAVADSYIDDNACRQKRQEAESGAPAFVEVWWKLYYSCEAASGAERLDSATQIANSTSFPRCQSLWETDRKRHRGTYQKHEAEARAGQALLIPLPRATSPAGFSDKPPLPKGAKPISSAQPGFIPDNTPGPSATRVNQEQIDADDWGADNREPNLWRGWCHRDRD